MAIVYSLGKRRVSIELNDLNWQGFPLFHNLDEPMVRKFLSTGFKFQYELGALLVSNNDQGQTFFMLLRGLAKLVLQNAQGEALSVVLFRAGDFFGELSVLEPDGVRNGDVVALSGVEVLAIQKKEFLKLLNDCPTLAINLARVLGQRLRLMNQRLITDRLPDDLQKVAHTLLLLSGKGRSYQKEGPVLLPSLSLKEWALFCYTSGDVFMSSIEQLKQIGALEWHNQRIVVTDLAKLRACAQVDQSRILGT